LIKSYTGALIAFVITLQKQ